MAYADFATYKAQYLNPQHHNYYRDSISLGQRLFASPFSHATAKQFPVPVGGTFVAAPTTAAACDSSTTGAMIRPLAGSGDQVMVGSYYQSPINDNAAFLIDRLSHQGGLVGNITTSQTTNLPTAALTRYTSGVGVYAALEVYTALGATDSVFTMVYTNQAGTGSRSASVILADTPTLNAFIWMPLQGTDSGVRSVESVSLTPSTGTAGNFGITLFKPLVWIPSIPSRLGRHTDIFDMPGWNTPILDAACLQLLFKGGAFQETQQVSMMFGES